MDSRVVVRTFNYRHEAEVVRGFLASAGVESFIISDDCGAVDPALEYGRGTHVLVAEKDRGRAVEVLAQEEDEIVER